MKQIRYLIIVYPYNGRPVYSKVVKCYNAPTEMDIRKLEEHFKGKVEVENLTCRSAWR